MAINVNGTVLRNLQEQVEKNKEDIETLTDLNLIGIRVVGVVATASALPDPTTYTGEYGDAYAVGTTGEYQIYVLTRPTTEIPSTHWLNLGNIGVKGDTGATPVIANDGTYITSTDPNTEVTTNVIALSALRGASTQWLTNAYNPSSITGYNVADMWLNTSTGDVYKVQSGNPNFWQKMGNIKGDKGDTGAQGVQGPQGVQGEQGVQGPQGDPGGFIKIVGTVDSASDLPNPTVLQDLEAAYLVGDDKILYMQIGSTYATAVWTNMGKINAATYVSVNGTYVGTWDSDTKLDKVSTSRVLYGTDSSSNQYNYSISESSSTYSIPQRDGNGNVKTGTAIADTDAVNKKYANDNLLSKTDAESDYVKHNASTESTVAIRNEVGGIAITSGNTDGFVTINTGQSDDGFVAFNTGANGGVKINGQRPLGVDEIRENYNMLGTDNHCAAIRFATNSDGSYSSDNDAIRFGKYYSGDWYEYFGNDDGDNYLYFWTDGQEQGPALYADGTDQLTLNGNFYVDGNLDVNESSTFNSGCQFSDTTTFYGDVLLNSETTIDTNQTLVISEGAKIQLSDGLDSLVDSDGDTFSFVTNHKYMHYVKFSGVDSKGTKLNIYFSVPRPNNTNINTFALACSALVSVGATSYDIMSSGNYGSNVVCSIRGFTTSTASSPKCGVRYLTGDTWTEVILTSVTTVNDIIIQCA